MLKAILQHPGSIPTKQVKTLVLPVEHGVWGFWLEPSLLGLLLAPSWAGLCLVLAALAAILCQQPLLIAMADFRRNKMYPRSFHAMRLALLFGLLAGILLVASMLLADTMRFILPLLLAAPLVVVQLSARIANRGRDLGIELLGASALSALVVSVVFIVGVSTTLGTILACIIVARNIPSILYVRARLRLERGEAIKPWVSIGMSALALLCLSLLTFTDLVPVVTLLAFVLLLFRAVWGLSRWRLPLKAKHIGMLEMFYGLIVVMSVWLGL